MFMGGTSMATPLAAGAVALIRQYLQQVHLHQPTGALLKAVLVHGATPLAGQYNPPEVQPPPDINQGWGRVNVENALFPPFPAHWTFRDDPADAVGTGEMRTYQFEVADAAVPLRVTLVWTDFPSSPSSGGGLVNRLRVSVVAPDGSITQGGPLNNNVQQALIAAPQPGIYTVRVIGLNVVSQVTANAKQDFALVVSGGLAFVDVYVRDDEADNGVEPRSEARFRSPDIWISSVDNPTAPASANPEPGKRNYVFVRVHNRGTSPAGDAEVRLFWSRLTTHPARRLWSAKGIQVDGGAGNVQRVSLPAASDMAPDQTAIVSFTWTPPALASAKPNYYCLLATVSHPADPLLQDDVTAARWEDNLAWRAVAVQETAPGEEASFPFYITGADGGAAQATLRIDCQAFPAGSRVRLKLPSRLLQGATAVNLQQVWQSPAGTLSRLEVTSRGIAELAGVALKKGENTLLRLEALLPAAATAQDYPVIVEQRIAGQIAGRINLVVRAA